MGPDRSVILRPISPICSHSRARQIRRNGASANVFPCGANAMFSNAVDHSFVVRRAKVAGVGNATKFETSDPEIRFSCRFDALERGATDQKPVQRGTCTLPDGQTLQFVVNDERGASTPDGVFRIFAGLRSDPFILAWIFAGDKEVPNLLSTTTCSASPSNSIRGACSIPTRARSSRQSPKRYHCHSRGAIVGQNRRASIGSAVPNRPICVLTSG